MYLPEAPKPIRRAVRRGIIAGYRGEDRDAAKARGHWHYCGWLDGTQLRGLTPRGLRSRIVNCT